MSEMNIATKEIANEFKRLKFKISIVTKMLHQNFNEEFMNYNFDDQELFEEQLDILVYSYEIIKKKIRKARLIKLKLEHYNKNMKPSDK